MTNIKLLGVLCFIILVAVGVPSHANATTEVAPVVADDPNPNAKDAQKLLDDIVMSDSYSQTHQHTSWEKKKKPTKNSSSNTNVSWLDGLLRKIGDVLGWTVELGSHIGVISKLIALVFLGLLIAWLYRTRQTWLSWVARLDIMSKKHTPHISHSPHTEQDTWADLPAHDELVSYVQTLLAQGAYLLALSVLYRGTLRKINKDYVLAIDRHQTEDECVWLLSQSPASPQESAFFGELVALWRACAYGKHLPQDIADNRQIHALTQTWSALYDTKD